jgi:tRNA nucleotidyltransferase/poly(A) polymerase
VTTVSTTGALSADREAEIRHRLAAAVPANVREVCRVLAAAGHQAVTVGGAVRDAILGRTPCDWDVATSAPPDAVIALFRHTAPTGIAHGTVTVVTGRDAASHVEVTTFRSEGAYSDGRRPDRVTLGVPLIDDLARRDLRVNAIAYDPQSGTLIDPYGGQIDIAECRLRAVGPTGKVYDDAVARFTEDGLRVMRAVRFAAALEFELDPDTERGIGPALSSLARVSKERICDELCKILAAREPSRALAIAVRTGIVALILPEQAPGVTAWAAARGVNRGAQIARWLGRVDAAAPVARLPALLAELANPDLGPDLGPPRLDRRSLRTVAAVLRRLKFSNDESAGAATAVGAAAAVRATGWTEPQIRRLLADAGRHHADTVLALWRAELTAAGGAATELAGLVASAETILVRGDALAVSELAVTGKDLMTALEMASGPLVGRLLAALLDRVLVDPSLNSRDCLIAVARGDVAAINPPTSGSNGVLAYDDNL